MYTTGVDTEDVRQLSLTCACLKFKNIYTMFSVHNFMSFGLVMYRQCVHGLLYTLRLLPYTDCHSDECNCLNATRFLHVYDSIVNVAKRLLHHACQ